jgi:hypothetical protein
MEDNNSFKRRKRSYSTDTILEYSDSDPENIYFDQKNRTNAIDFNWLNNNIRKMNITDKTNNNEIDKDFGDILNNINKLNIDTNKDLYAKIIKKIDDLEKKVDTLSMVNVKIDSLKKHIDKIFVEKDYVIENLRYEVNDLKEQIKDKIIESSYDIDNLSQKNIHNYYS